MYPGAILEVSENTYSINIQPAVTFGFKTCFTLIHANTGRGREESTVFVSNFKKEHRETGTQCGIWRCHPRS